MKKILYISLVDWNWIKQRPQIIAEGLASKFEVDCIFPKYYRKHNLSNNVNSIEQLHLHSRIKIPFSARKSIIKQMDMLYSKHITNKYVKAINPDVIYITHPDDYTDFIEKSDKYIVYDCMDNYPEFVANRKRKEKILQTEERLCKRANCIVVSSSYLFEKIQRYGVDNNRIRLVRNGYSGEIISIKPREVTEKEMYKIAYFGTIGPWFDSDILIEALKQRDNIEFHIAGPLEKQLPQNDRIKYAGIISHNQLYEYAEKCDALMMPFKLNEIVEAVDPVKLYEYINFNKPIISIFYKEIERFNDFVWFYTDKDSMLVAIDRAISGVMKYDNEQRVRFLSANSWSKRIEMITSIIETEAK